jgi:hypothetical protein
MIDQSFIFEFRQYSSYEGPSNPSGAYVFNTEEKDSELYHHEITSIDRYVGKNIDQFIINYINMIGQRSYAKVKIFKKNNPLKQIEFDIYFSGIPKPSNGTEVTINW